MTTIHIILFIASALAAALVVHIILYHGLSLGLFAGCAVLIVSPKKFLLFFAGADTGELSERHERIGFRRVTPPPRQHLNTKLSLLALCIFIIWFVLPMV